MAEGRSSRQERDEQRWAYGSLDQSLIVEEMETLGDHLKEWAERCRQGHIGAWVLFGKLHFQFWELVEALEWFEGGSGDLPPRESVELDA